MNQTYGIKSLIILNVICIVVFGSCFFIIHNKILFFATIAIFYFCYFIFLSLNYQIIKIKGNFLIFITINPFKKSIAIEFKDIDRILIKSQLSTNQLVFLMHNGQKKISSNMHIFEFKKCCKAIISLGLDVEIGGINERYLRM